MFKALIADDDRASAERIDAILRLAWPTGEITWLDQPMRAVEAVHDGSVDLVVLRVGTPAGDAHDAIALIRRSSDVRIVAVCPMDDPNAWLRSVELGSDEYVIEPFSPVELLARVKAVVGRGVEGSRLEDDAPTYAGDGLALDLVTGRARIQGIPICLTRPEVRLLGMLLASNRLAVTRRLLITHLWGTEDEATTYLRVYVRRLRERLGTERLPDVERCGAPGDVRETIPDPPHLSTAAHWRERTRS